MQGSDPSLRVEDLCNCDIFQLWVTVLEVWVPTRLCSQCFYLPCGFSFLISLVVEIFCASLQVILRDNFRVDCCNLGVSVAGGELSIFLLYHLDPLSRMFFKYMHLLL